MPLRRIAVIDDQDSMRVLCVDMISRCGDFEIVGFDSAASFLRHPSLGKFDAVFSDIEMPDMTGIDLLRQMRKAKNPAFRNMPFVIFSESMNSENVKAAKRHGATDYIVKPITMRDVDKALVRATRKIEEQPRRPINRNDKRENSSAFLNRNMIHGGQDRGTSP